MAPPTKEINFSHWEEAQRSQSVPTLTLTGFSVASPNKKSDFFLLGGNTEEPVRASAGSDWLLCGSSQGEREKQEKQGSNMGEELKKQNREEAWINK